MKESEILRNINEKLSISNLNEMQTAMLKHSATASDITLLSPTGSGKTLAFLIPLLKRLKPANDKVQAVIIAPSRELVLQIFEITRAIASGHKVTQRSRREAIARRGSKHNHRNTRTLTRPLDAWQRRPLSHSPTRTRRIRQIA